MPKFKDGDVVYAENSSAIVGDVVAVDPGEIDQDEERVTVRWRTVVTTEDADDLHEAAAESWGELVQRVSRVPGAPPAIVHAVLLEAAESGP